MRMREREHEPARFVSHIDIPADLETMQRFESGADAQKDQKRPPAEAQIAVGPLRAGRRVFGWPLHSARKIGFSSRSLRNRWKTSFRKWPSESIAVSG